MRRIFLMILFLGSSFIVHSQADASFTCADASSYRTQFSITPPDISETLSDVTVTALGRGNYEPVIGITASDNITDCYSYSAEAEYYNLNLPSGDIPPAFTNASGVVYSFGSNNIHIAEANGNTGALVLLLEAFIVEDNHSYQLNLTEEMLAQNADTNVYLVSLSDEYEPSLTLTDSEGTETIAEASEVALFSLYGDAMSAVAAPLPGIAGTVELSVNATGTGIYALIIELQSGAIQVGDGVANISVSEEGAISLTCDNNPIFKNGLRVTLPHDNDYTATVLATSIDPVLAVLDDDDTGICYDDTAATYNYSVDLPGLIIERDTLYPQANATSENTSLVFGGKENAAGSYVLLIEGGEVSADDEGDVFEISLTPQMLTAADVMMAYVFTTQLELDPILTWEPDEGEVVSCNDAGIPELCGQEVEDFSASFLSFGNSESILGIDYNPMLEIPLDPSAETTTIRLRVTAAEASAGAYILVLHIATD